MRWFLELLETFTTHPSEIHHLTYIVRGPPGTPSYSETLGVTAPHPFYVLGRETPGFVKAADLQLGDTLSLAHGGVATVTSNTIEYAEPGQTFTTYNFAVAEYHTYFVGEAAVWVHNSSPAVCQRIFSLYEAFVRSGTIRPIDAYDRILRRLSSISPESRSALIEELIVKRNFLGELRLPAQALQANEGVLIGAAEGLQSSKLLKFQNVIQGFHGRFKKSAQ